MGYTGLIWNSLRMLWNYSLLLSLLLLEIQFANFCSEREATSETHNCKRSGMQSSPSGKRESCCCRGQRLLRKSSRLKDSRRMILF